MDWWSERVCSRSASGLSHPLHASLPFQVIYIGSVATSLFSDREAALPLPAAASSRRLLCASPVLKGDKRRLSLKLPPPPSSLWLLAQAFNW